MLHYNIMNSTQQLLMDNFRGFNHSIVCIAETQRNGCGKYSSKLKEEEKILGIVLKDV